MKLIEKAISLWNTTLISLHLEGMIKIPGVKKIRRGIIQGDGLSLLLFCLALDSQSNLINEQEHGYILTSSKIMSKETAKVTHPLHMDDLHQTLHTERQKISRSTEISETVLQHANGIWPR